MLQKAKYNHDHYKQQFHLLDKYCINYDTGIFDKNQNGVIDFNEFAALWQYVTDWQKTFRSYDTDNSGTIDRNELKTGTKF